MNKNTQLMIFLGITLSSCGWRDDHEIFDLPRSEWRRASEQLPLRVRYDNYLYGMRHISPPAIELALGLASDPAVDELLISRLNDTKIDRLETEAISYIIVFGFDIYKRNICVSPEYRRVIVEGFSHDENKYAEDVLSRCIGVIG